MVKTLWHSQVSPQQILTTVMMRIVVDESTVQYQYQYNEKNLCQDLLTTENTNSNLKEHVLHYANELLVRDFPLKNCCRLNMQKKYKRNVWEKSNDTYLLSIRVQTMITTFLFAFYNNSNVKEKSCSVTRANREP